MFKEEHGGGIGAFQLDLSIVLRVQFRGNSDVGIESRRRPFCGLSLPMSGQWRVLEEFLISGFSACDVNCNTHTPCFIADDLLRTKVSLVGLSISIVEARHEPSPHPKNRERYLQMR